MSHTASSCSSQPTTLRAFECELPRSDQSVEARDGSCVPTDAPQTGPHLSQVPDQADVASQPAEAEAEREDVSHDADVETTPSSIAEESVAEGAEAAEHTSEGPTMVEQHAAVPDEHSGPAVTLKIDVPAEPEVGHKRPREESLDGAEAKPQQDVHAHLSTQPSAMPKEGPAANTRAESQQQELQASQATATPAPPMEGGAAPAGCASSASTSEAGTPTPTVLVDEKHTIAQTPIQQAEVPHQ